MKVLFVAAEAAPFIKVGGLGDVIGGLPKKLVEKGVDARVILPFYSAIKSDVREMLGSFFYHETESKPMIITVIQEV